MGKANPPSPAAFLAGAVVLVRTSGKGAPVRAREPGVSQQALRDRVAPAGRVRPHHQRGDGGRCAVGGRQQGDVIQ